MEKEYLLEVRGVEKYFPGVKALDKVNFTLKKGEIHALVGENGAGKSTLMNIIDGVLTPDAGDIFLNGEHVKISSPFDAQKLGIGFIHQEIALCPDVTVAENILMPQISMRKKFTVNYRELNAQAKELLQSLTDIDPDLNVEELTVSNQQVVEIARALSLDCKILILDEPTSALTESETESLFKIIRKLKQRNIGIIYISHRMAEVFDECDRVTILRDGKFIDTLNIKDADPRTVVGKMVGRDLYKMFPEKKTEQLSDRKILLKVENISDGEFFHNVSFGLKEGEILGFAGLIGAGRSEVAKAICAFSRIVQGEIFFNGERLSFSNPGDSIEKGIVYLTEDRKEEGLFLDMDIKKNISASHLSELSKYTVINDNKESDLGNIYINKMGVKCTGIENLVSSLSGGNQQKVLISKLLTLNPKIIFMDEPTRGIDVGAKCDSHN
ncbi:MAG: sugar ABC transporter ATP-binding protein [Spirochaetaceae bacterium]|jgi:ribose transport system ATP-binding protein|nr:sugar ABC transporter ATP-binding protein [Spirochaetaceae bacterium]